MIVPERCYHDARAGIAALEHAFGFHPLLIVPGASPHDVAHAELWLGRSCVMLASLVADGPWTFRSPADIGDANTGAPYIATPAVDALHAGARDAGFTLVTELAGTDYGSRDFSVRDREGFLWHVGTYSPRTGASLAATDEPELFCGARYRDARAAIDWLGRAFGAVEQFVIPGEGATIAHAQLLLGDDIFMLGSDHADRFGLRTPQALDGVYTQTLNVTVADPDAHCARAVAAGAELLQPPTDSPYGARGYVARDPEGYVWGFSTYAPAPAAVPHA